MSGEHSTLFKRRSSSSSSRSHIKMKAECFTPMDTGRRDSKHIEKLLVKWNKTYKDAIKILLLGAGEAGKTTILKQMKILHIQGFDRSERLEKVQDIRQNIHEAIYNIVHHMSELSPPIELENKENSESVKFILSLPPPVQVISSNSTAQQRPSICAVIESPTEYSEDFYEHTKRLWSDRGVRACYQRSNEFQLIDSAKYFLDQIDIIRKSEYVPSDQDILRCRRTTTSIQKIEFAIDIPKSFGGGRKNFWMFDVGGQRGERRKWIQVFEGIHAILFLVASSSFDQTLREDPSMNRLQEAMTLFESVWNSRFLKESGVIIFLNKQDVLEAKIRQGRRLQDYFSDYDSYKLGPKDGKPNDEYVKARCYIRDLFLDITKRTHQQENRRISIGPGFNIMSAESQGDRNLFWHFTTATDTKNIRTVFKDVHTLLVHWNVQRCGLD